MKIIYRISDNSYIKEKLPFANKVFCLKNFQSIFGENFLLIADNCSNKLKNFLEKNINCDIEYTSLGNAGSLRHALEIAMSYDNQNFYFVEDDYLHLSNSIELLEEGFELSDYHTIYDHPDKYTKFYNNGEFSKVIKKNNNYWRTTISTVMTFASNSKIIRKDWPIWDKYTKEFHPEDHYIFEELNKKENRLLVSIPGSACHVDLTFSKMYGEFLIENWAIDILEKEMNKQFIEYFNYSEFMPLKEIKLTEGWNKIRIMKAIETMLPENYWEHGFNDKIKPQPTSCDLQVVQ